MEKKMDKNKNRKEEKNSDTQTFRSQVSLIMWTKLQGKIKVVWKKWEFEISEFKINNKL